MSSEILVDGLVAYILVFARMGGIILLNPFLMRKNVPAAVKMALILGLTIVITPNAAKGMTSSLDMTGFVLVYEVIKELFVGFACGLIFQIFYYLLFVAGDVIDMGFGLSMAKAFDPGTNLQISVSGNLFQLLFVLYFFATDSHLIFIRIMASSYDIVGIGAVTFGSDTGGFLTTMFVSAFSLIVQLMLPFIVATFVLEMAMGILMKLIPQINVFSIHFQFKIILGFLLLFLFAVPVANFMENYIHEMLINMQNVFQAL